MPRPFVAYLRVYEPLSAFPPASRDRLRHMAENSPLDRADVGVHEQLMWLKSQEVGAATRLPGERPDGSPLPTRDVMAVRAESGELLVCPLDLRARSAAAVVGFLSTAANPLREATLGESADRLRHKAGTVLADMPGGAVHVVSTTWTVPLPWFVLVQPSERVVTGEGATRTVYWLIPMRTARKRVQRAFELAEATFGESGPTKVLQDTGRWLAHFHEDSMVELDYGGLVQLMADDDIDADTSAEDVNAILDAIEQPDPGAVAERFERLREFWSELAVRERMQ
ncbi:MULTISPECIES: hypothetical protein [Actinokineospora]|uniref:hypothetical protein n=1 Tax=Actinokineospora TaxID=39845 RepID=UPI0016711BAC|nr:MULTISPECIES: hypothetical protein [Actinokineospora]